MGECEKQNNSMEEQKKYDIFISYRREGGAEMADSIYQRLQNAGYSVFLDLEQLKSGKFNEQLLSVIDSCTDFIIVLPPNALDRCSDVDDWVRREVEHAIKKNKNIIPVMLRGFEWPDKNTLPEAMRELPNYEGLAATDYKLFPENMERLKSKLLRSKPGITWHRYKNMFIALSTVLLVAIGVLVGCLWYDKSKYEILCNEYSMRMMTECVKAHHNTSLAQDGLESFEDFYAASQKGEKNSEIKYFTRALNVYRNQLQIPDKIILSDDEKAIFRKHRIDLEDIDALYLIAVGLCQEIQNYFTTIETIATQEDLNFVLRDNIRYNYEAIELYLKVYYYGVLYIYASMPESVYAKLQPATAELTKLENISIRISKEECESRMQLQFNKLNEVLHKIGRDASELKFLVAQQENELQRQMIELQTKMETTYQNMWRKCLFGSEENVDAQWSKVLMFANFGNTISEFYYDMQQDNLPYTSYLTPSYVYGKLFELLDKYETYHPDAEPYIHSLRVYFSDVLNNQRLHAGVLIYQLTANHPDVQVGDIIVGYDNKEITNLESLKTAYQHNMNGQVKLLRIENNVLKEISLSSFGNTDIIGFWDITLPSK